MVATRNGDAVRLRPLDRLPRGAFPATGGPSRIRADAAHRQADRPGIPDPPRTSPDRPGLDAEGNAHGLLEKSLLRPEGGEAGTREVLPSLEKEGADPPGPPPPIPRTSLTGRRDKMGPSRRKGRHDPQGHEDRGRRSEIPPDDPGLRAFRDRLRRVSALRVREPRTRRQGPRNQPRRISETFE